MQLSKKTIVRGFAVLACCSLLSTGCGKSVEVVPIQGSVSYNGKPLKFGTVMFQPLSGGQHAQGLIQPDGTFTLTTHNVGEGACLGTNRVSVRCYENQDPAKQGGQFEGGQSLGRLLIPVKYTMASSSGITVDVKPDGNAPVVLELTDK